MIKTARLEKGLSQDNLAKRINISRYSVMAIEKGDPKVSIGIVFEAASIVGVPLFAESEQELQKLNTITSGYNSLLPKRVRHKKRPVDDNF